MTDGAYDLVKLDYEMIECEGEENEPSTPDQPPKTTRIKSQNVPKQINNTQQQQLTKANTAQQQSAINSQVLPPLPQSVDQKGATVVVPPKEHQHTKTIVQEQTKQDIGAYDTVNVASFPLVPLPVVPGQEPAEEQNNQESLKRVTTGEENPYGAAKSTLEAYEMVQFVHERDDNDTASDEPTKHVEEKQVTLDHATLKEIPKVEQHPEESEDISQQSTVNPSSFKVPSGYDRVKKIAGRKLGRRKQNKADQQSKKSTAKSELSSYSRFRSKSPGASEDSKLTVKQNLMLIVRAQDNEPERCPRIVTIILIWIVVLVASLGAILAGTKWWYPIFYDYHNLGRGDVDSMQVFVAMDGS